MTTVKIGPLEFKDYAAGKPVSVLLTGEFVTAAQVVETPALALGSLYALSEDLQTGLTLRRIELEPDFKLGIIGVGIVSKAELIEHVAVKSPLGLEVVQAEMTYCNELLETLRQGEAPPTPEMAVFEPESVPDEWRWIKPEVWDKWWRWFRTRVLFCENTTDSVTQYAATYRKKNVHSAFSSRRFGIYALEGTNDVRANFVPLAKKLVTVYISGIGHGSPTTYTGHLNSQILQVGGYDPAEVKGKVLHFLSCQTAKDLGPDTIKHGARAYAGYFENFTFVYDQPGTPINEMELFWKCDSTFDLMMAGGRSVEKAHEATMKAYNAAIAAVPNTAAATWLTWDRNYFRSPVTDAMYGDRTAKISPLIRLPLTPFTELEESESRFLVD